MRMEDDLKETLWRLEEELLRPDVRKSADVLAVLLADDFVEFGSSGRVFDKQVVVEELPDAPVIERTLTDFKINLLAPGVAQTTYRVVRHTEPPRHSLRSSIWKLIDGRWQMFFHQGTLTDE